MAVVALVAALVGYLLGSIPTAYLLVRWTSGGDIRTRGSGNVGALNAYEVTGKPWIGIVTALVDALKGWAAVMLARWCCETEFGVVATAGVMAVVGHTFNVFLRGHGGRGLATAAGVLLGSSLLPLLLWLLMWVTGYLAIRRDIHVGNMTATIATPILIASAPEPLVRMLLLLPHAGMLEHTLFVVGLAVPIFVRHLEPIRALFRRERD